MTADQLTDLLGALIALSFCAGILGALVWQCMEAAGSCVVDLLHRWLLSFHWYAAHNARMERKALDVMFRRRAAELEAQGKHW